VTTLPLRLRDHPTAGVLCVNDSGRFFATSASFVDRVLEGRCTTDDLHFLDREGHLLRDDDAFTKLAHLYALSKRIVQPGSLDYLILVPTLRCNLSCSYCQVSRAGLGQPGFDWSEATLAAVLGRLDELPGERIKIEFQGGEPTLRPDLIRAVIARCERFLERQFVICTNLQELSADILEIFDRPDVFISTSLDGDAQTHARNRTADSAATQRFLANLNSLVARYPAGKISALPTIDPMAPPDVDALLDSYATLGLDSIFLRPINFQGFARKRHRGSREQQENWRAYYRRVVRRIIERNWEDKSRILEETYFSICLRRIFHPGAERHVDLRNPNPMGVDYIVVDHDGIVYPTDEARMLARSGVIDLSIGDVFNGWNGTARDELNRCSTNQFDPACQRCAYQPYCGRDIVDDIARYGRIDVPRTDTEFCRRHLHLFDFIFELIYSDDPAARYSLARWLRLPATPDQYGITHQ